MYLVIPAASVSTRSAKTDNIVAWAAQNNLRLNTSKSSLKSSSAIAGEESCKLCRHRSPTLPGKARSRSSASHSSTKISASDHIRRVVSESAQTLYALRVLRHHGLSDVGLQEVFRTVVVSRLTYASTTWSGFVTAADIQRVDAFLRRSKRCGFCPLDLLNFGEQLAECDTQ